MTSEPKRSTHYEVLSGTGVGRGEGLYSCVVEVPGHGLLVPAVFAVYRAHRSEAAVYRKKAVLLTVNGTALCPFEDQTCILEVVNPVNKNVLFEAV